ncbi:hypothetical protein Ddc_18642 [Ditylenchus destructor]|nr:hypothetical protein Ddc_18642 [Ditylenchus destructor]
MSCYNSELASFHTPKEYDFIVELQAKEIPLPKKRNSWIGLKHDGSPKSDVPDKKAKNRFDLSFVDGTPMFNFTNMDDAEYGHYWGYNGLGSSTHGWEPNGEKGQYCVVIGEYILNQTLSSHGVMNDYRCGHKFYYTAPPYQIWPPPQPAGYNVPSYAIAPPFSIAQPQPQPAEYNVPSYAIVPPLPIAQPQPQPEYMVMPMNYGYYNGYVFPSRNGPNDFYNKALAAFDSDLDPIDLFDS